MTVVAPGLGDALNTAIWSVSALAIVRLAQRPSTNWPAPFLVVFGAGLGMQVAGNRGVAAMLDISLGVAVFLGWTGAGATLVVTFGYVVAARKRYLATKRAHDNQA